VIAEALLLQGARVFDEQRRLVRVLAFRGPEPRESRVPVAQILAATTGKVRTSTVEEYERAHRATRAA